MKLNGEYIDILAMNHLLDEAEIPRLAVLSRGTFAECLEYPNEFNSELASNLLELPEIEGNICEGTVIKSVEPLRLPNGERAILKNKNSKWTEKKKVKKNPTVVPDHITEMQNIAESYITENRLRNVISKVGPITEVRYAFGALMKPFTNDIIEDFMLENESFSELEKAERGLVTKHIAQVAGKMIRSNLGNIVDGEF
jgi:Rnl2 family RNA ligase